MRENLAHRAKEIIEQRTKYREEARTLPVQLQGAIVVVIEADVEE